MLVKCVARKCKLTRATVKKWDGIKKNNFDLGMSMEGTIGTAGALMEASRADRTVALLD